MTEDERREFFLNLASNILGNKITDSDRDNVTNFCAGLLIEIKEQLNRIEAKLDLLNKKSEDDYVEEA